MQEKPIETSDEQPKPARRRRRWIRVLLLLFLLLLALVYVVYVLPFWGIPFNKSRHGRPPLTPPWALECWVWEDDHNTEAFVRELLAGYAQYDFPVRTILIDSPWSWQYNDFKVDERLYPEPEKFFRDLKTNGYRIVLWMTCMVNNRSKDTKITDSKQFFSEARGHGYLAGNGYQVGWWKGKGGFIDYTDPAAMKWWHGLQQQVFDWGLDGWKLDGCDTFFSGKLGKVPVPFNRAHQGWLTTRQYMDHYARDEYLYGLTQNPQFVIMVRALDHPWSHPEGFAPIDAAAVTWVGDNQHTWKYNQRGIEAAIEDILGSARLGYCIIGSDIAGYHGRSNPDDTGPATAALLSSWKSKQPAEAPSSPEFGTGQSHEPIAANIYIRWAEFSCFCGFFLNGGHGERRLWKRTPAELEIVRKFSWLHTELVPYIYSYVVTCNRGRLPLMRPLSHSDLHYLFGDDFLVAPIHEDKLSRTVSLPAGKWRYFFDDRELIQGPATLTRDFPLDEYPVFIREGAIVPLQVSRAYTGLGDKHSAEFVTWLIYPDAKSEFTLFHPDTHPHPEPTTVKVDSGSQLQVSFSGRHTPHILRIFSKKKPAAVVLDGKELAEGNSWTFDGDQQRIRVTTREYSTGNYTISWK